MKGFIVVTTETDRKKAIRVSTIKEVVDNGVKTTIYTKVGTGSINSRSIYKYAKESFDEVLCKMSEAIEPVKN